MLGLITKVIEFGLSIFVKNQAKREALRLSYLKFINESSKDSKISTDLHDEYGNLRSTPWQKKETSKK